MNYKGVITDEELEALQARNVVRRGEAVRELGAGYTLHPSHAPRHRKTAQKLVDEWRAKNPRIVQVWRKAAS